jgi:uracil-DNA glycosylase
MKWKIDSSWKSIVQEELNKDYCKAIQSRIEKDKIIGKEIFPSEENIFSAFQITSLENTKVVILGQDPYHGIGQAHGLSFSVPKGIKIPPSLKNIYKELQTDIGFKIPNHGNLSSWAEQGVLLLNASLTVVANEANSHSNIGWQIFTDAVIQKLSKQKENIVFLLWGKFAQQKAALIDKNKHCILIAAHPSPLSAYQGFFGCKHFSAANFFLQEKGIATIDWQIQ